MTRPTILAMSVEVGQVFAGYTILRELGTGGMGRVYLARHPRLPREEALKILPAELTGDPEYRARFEREAALAAGLNHPHILRIHDRGECQDRLWISMEYVDGTDVARLLLEQFPGGMPLDAAAPILTAVGSALDYAHHRGLFHRDVKPANILLTAPGGGQPRRVFLADFGLARRIDDTTGLTATDATVGTVAYLAPEQLTGYPVDGRADQYALACTAFNLLTGVPPYRDSNPAVVISQHINVPPPPIGAYRSELAALNSVFAKAMAKYPADRFGSCAEFAAQLSQQLNPGFAYAGEIPQRADTADTQPAIDRRVPALPGAPADRKRLAQRPGLLIGALVSILLLIAGGVFAVVKLTQSHKPGTAARNAPSSTSTAVANTGPFTGVYRADFSKGATFTDTPVPGVPPSTDSYAVRSACGTAGCVATASHLGGETTFAPAMVFDEVGGRWLGVAIGLDKCQGAPAEIWEVFTLQPGPDGAFTGEFTATTSNNCVGKHTVTFTRTGDVDLNSLPDPAGLPPRVVSPAEALRGSYHEKRTFRIGRVTQETDYAVTTDCLRTGDRCMSFFHAPSGAVEPLVFGDGNWALDTESDTVCPGRNTPMHVKKTGQYPLPQPPQDPITLLSGQGKQEQTQSCPVNVDFDETFTRTGD
ncbi:Serine/threonine-protein kinase PknF [Mycobacterium persicum]|uniref:non-specific serine/threonine protein kinase n=2 Tax=Mycobacterium persicum TaxID=1487726 RepID=A0AB38UTP4_9MYCO|nr:Serine/threonine-protein kinase PknF [Mycobacterium persicum]